MFVRAPVSVSVLIALIPGCGHGDRAPVVLASSSSSQPVTIAAPALAPGDRVDLEIATHLEGTSGAGVAFTTDSALTVHLQVAQVLGDLPVAAAMDVSAATGPVALGSAELPAGRHYQLVAINGEVLAQVGIAGGPEEMTDAEQGMALLAGPTLFPRLQWIAAHVGGRDWTPGQPEDVPLAGLDPTLDRTRIEQVSIQLTGVTHGLAHFSLTATPAQRLGEVTALTVGLDVDPATGLVSRFELETHYHASTADGVGQLDLIRETFTHVWVRP